MPERLAPPGRVQPGPRTQRQDAVVVVSAGARGIETTAEHMAGVVEYHIPWLDIELYRLLALVQEGADLGLGQVEHMAGCVVSPDCVVPEA